jgi:hypothetical protein
MNGWKAKPTVTPRRQQGKAALLKYMPPGYLKHRSFQAVPRELRVSTSVQAVGKCRIRYFKWRSVMQVAGEKSRREDIFNEILDTLREWPNLNQQIFAQAHYRGRSVEAISRSFNLDAAEVRRILQQCDRKLYASLRRFRDCRVRKSVRKGRKPDTPTTCRLVLAGCSI